MLAQAVFVVTAYAIGCDTKPGARTRAGTLPVVGFTAAADPRVLPLGSVVAIEGLGERQVHDVGGGVRGRHVDVFVDSCRDARFFGRQRRSVRVVHIGGVNDCPGPTHERTSPEPRVSPAAGVVEVAARSPTEVPAAMAAGRSAGTGGAVPRPAP